MGVLSLLPAEYIFVETWLKRSFFIIGVIILGPWAALLIYDLALYIARSLSYEIPVYGGRARGKARPRAPSLTERPSGHRRKFSLTRHRDPYSRTGGRLAADAPDPHWRNIQEEKEEYLAEDNSVFE